MDEALEELLQIGDELHRKHTRVEWGYGACSGFLIDMPLCFKPSMYIGFCKPELKHPAEIILDYIQYIDDWTEFLNHSEWNFERNMDAADTVEELLESADNEELKKLSKEEVSRRFYAETKEIHTGYQNIRDRLEDLLPDVLEEGDELWDRQKDLDGRYHLFIHFDGGATRSLEKYWYEEDDEKFKKAYLKYIKDCVKELKKSDAALKKKIQGEENAWIQQLPKDLRTLPKEEIRRQFEKEYSALLLDYEKLESLISRSDIAFQAEIPVKDAPGIRGEGE